MTITQDSEINRDLLARLDRLPVWPYPAVVLWVIGTGYFMAFFDITNIAYGLPIFSKIFHMTRTQDAYPISSSLFGYILGSWVNSNLADLVGRKRGIVIATLCFSIGCLGSTFANSMLAMVFWRFVTGMGIGAEIAIISAYISEIAPVSMRGRYTGWTNVFAFTSAAVVPFLALALVPNFTWGWRAMFLIGSFGVFSFLAFPFIPESPRWLSSKHRYSEAQTIVELAEKYAQTRMRCPLPAINACAGELEFHGFPTTQLFRPPYLGRLALLFGIWFIWYAGMYTWLGLGPTFFVAHGYTLTHSIFFLAASSFGTPIGALLAALLGDALERKYLILIGLLICAGAFSAIAIVASPIFVYISVFMLGMAAGFLVPLMYALTAESFPTRARATGISLTDGVGHLGGAMGPVLATMVFARGGELGFTFVFLLVAAAPLVAALAIPFSISATQKVLEIVAK